jgi:hypothetical protein
MTTHRAVTTSIAPAGRCHRAGAGDRVGESAGRTSIDVPRDVPTIQAAVDAAAPGGSCCGRDGDWDHREVIDAGIASRTAGIDGKVVGHGSSCDHGIVGASRGFATCLAQGRGNPAEGAGRGSVERQRVEVSFSLLYVGLAGGPFGVVGGDERSHGQLSERDRRDEWLGGKTRWIRDARQYDHGAGVENAAHMHDGRSRHSVASRTRSMSARNDAGSTLGRRRHRCSSWRAGSGRRSSGRSSAIGSPSRVTINTSPAATRLRISPPRLRKSRTATPAMRSVYHG